MGSKNVIILILLFLCNGCATTRQTVTLHMESDPSGMPIEADSVQICDSTPCVIQAECQTKGHEIYYSAKPPQGSKYFAESHFINPCQALTGADTVFFNLTSDPAELAARQPKYKKSDDAAILRRIGAAAASQAKEEGESTRRMKTRCQSHRDYISGGMVTECD